jgi:hypothetical protein
VRHLWARLGAGAMASIRQPILFTSILCLALAMGDGAPADKGKLVPDYKAAPAPADEGPSGKAP